MALLGRISFAGVFPEQFSAMKPRGASTRREADWHGLRAESDLIVLICEYAGEVLLRYFGSDDRRIP